MSIILTSSENTTQSFLLFNSTISNQIMLQQAREAPLALSLYSFQESCPLSKIAPSGVLDFECCLKIQKFMLQLEALMSGL